MTAETDEFARLWADKPNREKAIEYAKAFVAEHKEDLMEQVRAPVRAIREAMLDDAPDLDDLVRLSAAYRKQGMAEAHAYVEMLIQAGYEPKKITGAITVPGLRKGR